MQLTIDGKKYTFVYTVAATMCDDLLESVVSVAEKMQGKGEQDGSLAVAGRLPSLTKSLFYGGLLQMHGEYGDKSVRTREDAEKLMFRYLSENDGKREGTLGYLFNALYGQMGEDNFLSRIGLTGDNDEKVTPISKGKKSVGGEE